MRAGEIWKIKDSVRRDLERTDKLFQDTLWTKLELLQYLGKDIWKTGQYHTQRDIKEFESKRKEKLEYLTREKMLIQKMTGEDICNNYIRESNEK